MLLMQCGRPPLADPEVRRALRLALDLDFSPAAEPDAALARSLVPPGLPGHDADLPRPRRDLDTARRVLRDKGLEGTELTLVTLTTRSEATLADTEGYLRFLPEVGLKIREARMDQAEYYRRLREGRFDLVRVGWIADYPDADSFLYALCHSDAQRTFSLGYLNPELDALLEEARRTIDPDHRADLYRRARRLFHDEAPLVPLTTSGSTSSPGARWRGCACTPSTRSPPTTSGSRGPRPSGSHRADHRADHQDRRQEPQDPPGEVAVAGEEPLQGVEVGAQRPPGDQQQPVPQPGGDQAQGQHPRQGELGGAGGEEDEGPERREEAVDQD